MNKTGFKTVHVVSKWFKLLANLFGNDKKVTIDTDGNVITIKTFLGKKVIVDYKIKYKKVK